MSDNVFKKVEDIITQQLLLISKGEVGEITFTVEPPKQETHGEMATNVAMTMSKKLGMRPRDLADLLATKLTEDKRFVNAEVAGPGFINLTLAPVMWEDELRQAIRKDLTYGRNPEGSGERVNIEFVSANPTGPMHVGHLRGAVFGDTLASLLKFNGDEVTREYYVNDAGGQVKVLARSAFERYREACGLVPDIREGMYPGEYLRVVGEEIKEFYGTGLLDEDERQQMDTAQSFALGSMMKDIENDLSSMEIWMDHYASEGQIQESGAVEAALQVMRDKSLIYNGVLPAPRGKPNEDWEEREQTLFRSTAFGDDVDRAVMKSDGSWTYFALDIAYHADKINRGFDRLINVFGADHGGYVKRLKAVVNVLSDGKVPLDVSLMQLVRLVRDGKEVKMSKRTGNFVTLAEVIEEVGADVARFHILTRSADTEMDFDLDKVIARADDNHVWYVQYASARISSVLDKVEMTGISVNHDNLSSADLSLLTHPAEREIIRKIASWPRVMGMAARTHEPHRLAFYVQDLAASVHSLWNKGQAEPELRFLREGEVELSRARAAMLMGAQNALGAAMAIMGVSLVDELRREPEPQTEEESDDSFSF